MPIKLVAIDIDGTLKAKDAPITPRTKASISNALKKGIRVVLSTGRGLMGTKPILRELMLTEPVIVFGGAMIVDPVSEETICMHTLPEDVVTRALMCCNDLGIHSHLYQGDMIVCNVEDDYLLRYTSGQGIPYRIDPDMIGGRWKYVPKILAMVRAEEEMQMLSLVRDALKDYAEVSKTEPGYIEINAIGTSKGEAVRMLAERFGIKREETAAIGDSFLDMSMIEWAGEGLAVSNALPEVLSIADRILPACWEDGVAIYLEELASGC